MIGRDLAQHYRIVLADMQGQRDRLAQELSQLDAAIDSMRRLIGVELSSASDIKSLGQAMMVASPIKPESPRFGGTAPINFENMSIRWAVLGFMAEVVPGPVRTAHIVAGLRQGGMNNPSPNFGNMVSAVVSNLKAKGEVEVIEDGYYRLTAAGRAIWDHIKSSPRFSESQGDSSKSQPLLS